MINIMFVVTSLNMGGAEKQVYLLAQELKKIGHSVSVVSMVEPKFFFEELTKYEVRVFSLNMVPGKASAKAIWQLAKIIKAELPDVIHSHMYHANILCRILRFVRPIKVLVSTAHNIDEFEGSKLRRVIYRLTRPLSTYMTNVSRLAYEHYVKLRLIDPSNGSFEYNGLRTKDYKWDPKERMRVRASLGLKEEFMWLAAGRFTEAKDYPNLVAAFKQVIHRTEKNIRLYIVGDGPLAVSIHGLIVAAGLTSCVHMLGIRKDVPSLLAACDGFVLSSAWEGMPMVLLEAIASGKPIVATDVGGVSELASIVGSGEIVAPSDPSLLADAICKVMNVSDRDSIGDTSTAARQILEETFDIRIVANRWIVLYQRLLGI